MELPHWILRQESGFALCVRPQDASEVAEEIVRFEAEGRPSPATSAFCSG